MLVLARGVGQVVEMMDGVIEIEILSITGSIVRLGFKAPAEVPIRRKEVAEKIRAERKHEG